MGIRTTWTFTIRRRKKVQEKGRGDLGEEEGRRGGGVGRRREREEEEIHRRPESDVINGKISITSCVKWD